MPKFHRSVVHKFHQSVSRVLDTTSITWGSSFIKYILLICDRFGEVIVLNHPNITNNLDKNKWSARKFYFLLIFERKWELSCNIAWDSWKFSMLLEGEIQDNKRKCLNRTQMSCGSYEQWSLGTCYLGQLGEATQLRLRIQEFTISIKNN